MNIIVCIKQVPNTTKVEIDEETGSLKRSGVESKMNPYDLYALEAALEIREKLGGKITALTMGPLSAKEIIEESFMLGVDEGFILSDRSFAGSDVLATSYTLCQGVKFIGKYDLIICGKQTTDGDTSQVGPAMAEHLGIPHVSWVKTISRVTCRQIEVEQDLTNSVAKLVLHYPCLITVETTVNQPRLPSYLLKQASKDKKITVLTLEDLGQNNINNFGQLGSPTSVERIFSPASKVDSMLFTGEPSVLAAEMLDRLQTMKFI